MTIYSLLRLLVQGVARHGGMTADEVKAAVNLIGKLEAIDAFGTVTGVTEGEPEELRKKRI